MGTFTFPGDLTEVDYGSFLSQHDVVYLGPAPYGIDGLPVGNGELGAVMWTPEDHLRLTINKVDLWDDGPDGPFSSWGDEAEEVSTMLRSAASLSIGHGLPSFDRLYLMGFEARLRLADAQVEIQAETPFSKVGVEVIASQAEGCLVVRYRDETEEDVPRRFELARWGTRSLLHWYRKIKRVVPLSLMGTEAGADGKYLWIQQPLRGMHFAVVARLDGPVQGRRLHRRAGVFESEPVKVFEGTLYVAVVNSEEAEDPLAAAKGRVDAAVAEGYEGLVKEHRGRWRRFWEASFVDLPPEQDYVENLWYLNSYFVNSACKGRYPPNHIHAIWGWNRDVFPWGHYYHWNEQMHIYSLHATGHGELAMPHYRWRRAMLEHAVEDARRVHGREGAFYSDVSNRKGYQATGVGTSHNLTPGPQIAAQFWQHYQFTRDENFLRECAYPVIREVARFYLATVQRQEDGRYTFIGTKSYESHIPTRDTLTDLAHARQLFGIFLEASDLLGRDGEHQRRSRRVLDNLADYATMLVPTESWVDPDSIMDMRPILFKELAPGDPTVRILSLGYKVPGRSGEGGHLPDGTPLHEGMANPATHLWLFGSSTMAPIFPANQIGLDQKGTPEFEVAVNTARVLGYINQGIGLWPVAKARLGLAEELESALEERPQLYQIFPQGFSHYFSYHPDMEEDPRYLKEILVAGSPGETIHWPIATSLHMSIEAIPILQFTINEMLLQSYSGTIRVFPAVTKDWEGQFRLHAVGRFVVSATRAAGETSYVIIESAGGETCRIANPWPGKQVALFEQSGGWSEVETLDGDVLGFATKPGKVYILVGEGQPPGDLERTQVGGVSNRGPKTLGRARLGMPKGF